MIKKKPAKAPRELEVTKQTVRGKELTEEELKKFDIGVLRIPKALVGIWAAALLTALLLGPPASGGVLMQKRPPCTYTVNGKTNITVTLGTAGGTVTVQVAAKGSDCTWTANPDSSFLAIVGQSATTGDGTFTFSVAPLAHTAGPRSGKITVPAIGSPTYVVIQQNHDSP